MIRPKLMKPIPKEWGTMEFSIIRDRSGMNKLYPKYTLLAKHQNSDSEMPVLVAKKRSGNKTSNYLISMNIEDPSAKSKGYLGKIR